MKVLFVSSEAAPFAKSGGLGDVAGSLPAALAVPGTAVRVILPLYGAVSSEWRDKMTFVEHFEVTLAWRTVYCGVFSLKVGGVLYYFIDNEAYFKRDRLYGHFDDGERFAFFSRAVAEWTARLAREGTWRPDVIHSNDWQTALVPIYIHELMRDYPELFGIKNVFTIHNIEYQGRYGKELLADLFGLPASWYLGGKIEFSGDISLMKAAILTSDAVTTVSPTYAQELRYPYYAYGLDGVINSVGDRFSGILNGIDTVSYNPTTDGELAENYSATDMEGKAGCKADLQKMLGLEINPFVPVVASVGRLVGHKGVDLIVNRFDSIMSLGVQFVVLGTGEYGFEQFFRHAAERYPGRVASCITFNESLARRIYAGSDIFLMPSQKEPCGLSQMIAMRYGTIPVVRETGGLRDTVPPYNEFEDTGAGFAFANYNPDEMVHILWMASNLYTENHEAWLRMAKRDMERDFTWQKSAGEYRALYKRICG